MKKRRSKSQAKKKIPRDSESQVRVNKAEQSRRNRQKVLLQTLQQETISCDDARAPNVVGHSLVFMRDKMQAFPRNCSMLRANANKRDDDDPAISINKCYRCKHFSDIPPVLSQPSCERISGVIGQCETDISFVQAIVWLSSNTAYVSQLSIEQLQQVFDRQWSTRNNYLENRSSDNVQQQLKRRMDNSSVNSERIDNKDMLTMLTPENFYPLMSQDSIAVRSSVMSEKKLNIASTSDINESIAHVYSAQEERANYIAGNLAEGKRQKMTLPESNAIPVINLCNSDLDMSESETFDSWAEYQMRQLELDKRNIRSAWLTPKNYTERVNEEASPHTTDIGNVFNTPQLAFDNNFKHIFLRQKMPLFMLTDDQKERYETTELTVTQSEKVNDKSQLDVCFDEDFITPVVSLSTVHDTSSQMSACNINNYTVTQDNISVVNIDMEQWTPRNYDDFDVSNRTDQLPTDILHNNKSEFNIELDNLNKPHMQMSSVVVNNYDSAYNTLSTETLDHRDCIEFGETAKLASYNNAKHTYNLRPRKKKAIMHKEPAVSAEWLNSTLNSQYVERVILESVKVILWTLSEERLAEEYATLKRWKRNLKEEAVNAVLNVSDILRFEGKPDICRKEIVTTLIKTLDKITTCVQLNKTSVCVYRVQIILQLCNSVSVCVAIIDHLIMKLKSFQLALTGRTKIQRGTYTTINQLHLVFYALNITLRKYRTVVPNDFDVTETAISHVTDLWKTRYVGQELEHVKFHAKDTENRWRSALEDFAMTASAIDFVQFAEKSLSLAYILTRQ